MIGVSDDGEPRSARRYRRRDSACRDRRVTVRLSGDELAVIDRAAGIAGLTVAGFCGWAAIGAAQRADGVAESGRDQLAEMQRHLYEARVAVNRVGTNLNQAVVALNATGVAPTWLHYAVERCNLAVQRLDEVVSSIHRRLR